MDLHDFINRTELGNCEHELTLENIEKIIAAEKECNNKDDRFSNHIIYWVTKLLYPSESAKYAIHIVGITVDKNTRVTRHYVLKDAYDLYSNIHLVLSDICKWMNFDSMKKEYGKTLVFFGDELECSNRYDIATLSEFLDLMTPGNYNIFANRFFGSDSLK